MPRDTPIRFPASACVRSSTSQSFRDSNSSRDRMIRSTAVMGMPVGLNALPLKAHLQLRGFLARGDMGASLCNVHMHICITGRRGLVKKESAPDSK